MPWTIKDVDDHRKGLTQKQKRKWVKIANNVYDVCNDSDNVGNYDSCEAKAIIIANKFFKEK